jgi:hypothetical protein
MEPPMNISVTAPFKPAWNHMVRILFKPFDIKKWFALGFCAFLSQCGEGGGGKSGSLGNQNNPGGSEFREGVNNVEIWINNNWGLFLGIAIGSVMCILIINLLVLWISSRGKFMLLDGIVKNRAAVIEPWNEFKTQANSLCIFRFILSIISLLCVALMIGLPAYLAYPDFQADTWGSGATNALVAFVCLSIPFAIAATAIAFFLGGFVVPTMYLRRVRVMEGWSLAWGRLCKDHLGSAFLLFLLLVVLGIGVGVIAIAVTCATCCLAALPYISSVVFLPVTVFFTCFFLVYIEQFGNEWKFFKRMCGSCGYDMQGLPDDSHCPECGK